MTRRRNQVTPLQLVGIRNSAKDAGCVEFWNDKEMDRLRELEQEYEKLKAAMNKTLHQLNILYTAKKSPDADKMKKYEDLRDQLVAQQSEVHRLSEQISKVNVMPANKRTAKDITSGTEKNMMERLKEINVLKDAIKQILEKS